MILFYKVFFVREQSKAPPQTDICGRYSKSHNSTDPSFTKSGTENCLLPQKEGLILHNLNLLMLSVTKIL